jgi:putative resolvase
MYVDAKIAKKYYSVSTDTLRRWHKNGKLDTIQTEGKHRRYYVPDKCSQETRRTIAYARVSSLKQKSDLQNQIDFLKQKYPNYEIISDIGSGINFKRKGFRTILEQLYKGNVKEVVVASKDRFSRFGFDFFEFTFDQFDAKLVSINTTADKSPQEELAEDLLSITTVFSARYHGMRKYKQSNKENTNIS